MSSRTLRVFTIAALCAASACTARGSSRTPESVQVRLGFVGTDVPGTGIPAATTLLSTSTLFVRDPSSPTPAPAIVERADVSADGLTYHLHVRQGIRAHDGTPITASTLEQTFADLSKTTAPPMDVVEWARVSGDAVLDVRLRRPSALFLENLVDVQPIGGSRRTGAFVRTTAEGDDVTFHAFDGFYLGPPTVDTLTIKVFPTWRTAWGAMLRGEVDGLWETPTEAIDFIEAASDFRSYETVRRYAYLLGFNTRAPRLRDARVRRAFAHALDRDRFVRVALRGRGQPAQTQLHPGHWAADPAFRALPFDRDTARALLREAGFSDRQGRSTVSGSAEIECLVPADDRFERAAQELQRQLSSVGIELRLVPVAIPDLAARLSEGRFETYVLEAAGLTPTLLERFWAPGTRAGIDAGYTAAVPALARLRAAGSVDEVRRAVSDVQAILRDDPPAVFLAYPTVSRVLHRRFEVPTIPDDGSLISQRVLPFVRLRVPNGGPGS